MEANIKNYVVSLDYAKQLTPASFCTTLFVWEVPIDGKPVVRERSCGDCMTTSTVRGRPGHKWYPAPTLHEIMVAVKRLLGKPARLICQLDEYVDFASHYHTEPQQKHEMLFQAAPEKLTRPENQMAWLWIELEKERKRKREAL